MAENNLHKPLLSICIPTYNRSYYLEKTLKSIVNQKTFYASNNIEIIILDNFSSDNTKDISIKYVIKFPDKIRYFCNDKNIFDETFERTLSYGNGRFLKLNNDTLIHKADSLEKMLEIIERFEETKPLIFFSNLNEGQPEIKTCGDLNGFIEEVSFQNTWIGSFGIWKEHFRLYNLFGKYSKLNLTQTGVLFSILSEKKKSIIYNKVLFESIIPRQKGGYNIAEIFGQNYLTILKEFL